MIARAAMPVNRESAKFPAVADHKSRRGAKCETSHTRLPELALSRRAWGRFGSGTGHMRTRRLAYWWFRVVASGRFLQKFLKLRRS
jgi:hypothetical protein